MLRETQDSTVSLLLRLRHEKYHRLKDAIKKLSVRRDNVVCDMIEKDCIHLRNEIRSNYKKAIATLELRKIVKYVPQDIKSKEILYCTAKCGRLHGNVTCHNCGKVFCSNCAKIRGPKDRNPVFLCCNCVKTCDGCNEKLQGIRWGAMGLQLCESCLQS